MELDALAGTFVGLWELPHARIWPAAKRRGEKTRSNVRTTRTLVARRKPPMRSRRIKTFMIVPLAELTEHHGRKKAKRKLSPKRTHRRFQDQRRTGTARFTCCAEMITRLVREVGPGVGAGVWVLDDRAFAVLGGVEAEAGVRKI